MLDSKFWKGKKVFITGHTGFKGSWLSLWLTKLGAEVTGYALLPQTTPSMFDICNLKHMMDSRIGNIIDRENLEKIINEINPDIVFHLAAQPYVGESYKHPVETFETNVLGTVNVLEAVRRNLQKGANIRAVLNVTTDKCYVNKEWYWGYRENEPLGGKDPYSSSKACSELVTASYRDSFFTTTFPNVGIATARAGNVIGGGDWSPDRLIPQCLDAILKGQHLQLRNPLAIRPWQHVLEPLCGYLILAEKLYKQGSKYADAWNFGPDFSDCQTVEKVVQKLLRLFNSSINLKATNASFQEANLLMLDCSKAKTQLEWSPVWNLDEALKQIHIWTEEYKQNNDMRQVSISQINKYMRDFEQRVNLHA
ncbi:CDP-glucose 4,6-dehydratase [Bacillus alkalicellulosilyticus]|uniref:CDP-glucose 4,6-dehydratase n=1 Tax=Alkalihalobacterium alkalicellulosilyticum TaxID=1912214 RepID=UPI00099736E3|nr:CDP-glucose 4,6-dehydratase [Bacillus alkalicellulosilyticus]